MGCPYVLKVQRENTKGDEDSARSTVRNYL